MLKYLSVFLIFVALAQVNAAESDLQPTTNDTTPPELSQTRIGILLKATKEVLKLKGYALQTALVVAANVDNYKKSIHSMVEVSLQNINDQLEDLENEVKNATKEAKANNKSVAPCVHKERFSRLFKIRSGRILKCKKSLTFELLKLKLAKLTYIKVKAATIIPSCSLLHPISNKNLKDCIQKGVDDAYSTANSIKAEINNDASNMYDKANNCIEDNLGDVDLDIEEIEDNFRECVQDTMKRN